MIILGVDPGLRMTGYAAIEAKASRIRVLEGGVIKPVVTEDVGERLFCIYRGIAGLIRDYSPEVLVLEKIFSHYRHPSTAILMGHARGVVCLAAGEKKIKIVDILPTRVKKSVSTHGHASKDQVKRSVMRQLSLEDKKVPSDVSDALAVATSYVRMNRFL